MCEVKIIESPRDAMQGLSTFIPTKDKARYINGLGGCPMAENRLVGNLRTSNLLEYLEANDVPVEIDDKAFDKAYETTLEVFKLNNT